MGKRIRYKLNHFNVITEKEADEGTCVGDIIRSIKDDRVVVIINNKFFPKGKYDTTLIKDGDMVRLRFSLIRGG